MEHAIINAKELNFKKELDLVTIEFLEKAHLENIVVLGSNTQMEKNRS